MAPPGIPGGASALRPGFRGFPQGWSGPGGRGTVGSCGTCGGSCPVCFCRWPAPAAADRAPSCARSAGPRCRAGPPAGSARRPGRRGFRRCTRPRRTRTPYVRFCWPTRSAGHSGWQVRSDGLWRVVYGPGRGSRAVRRRPAGQGPCGLRRLCFWYPCPPRVPRPPPVAMIRCAGSPSRPRANCGARVCRPGCFRCSGSGVRSPTSRGSGRGSGGRTWPAHWSSRRRGSDSSDADSSVTTG